MVHRYAAFAIGVLRDIYALHRYTTHSASLPHTLDPQFQRLEGVEPHDLTADLELRLRTLSTQSIRITLASSASPRLLATL